MHIQTFSAYVIRLGRVMKVRVTSITFYLVIGQAELNKAETKPKLQICLTNILIFLQVIN